MKPNHEIAGGLQQEGVDDIRSARKRGGIQEGGWDERREGPGLTLLSAWGAFFPVCVCMCFNMHNFSFPLVWGLVKVKPGNGV